MHLLQVVYFTLDYSESAVTQCDNSMKLPYYIRAKCNKTVIILNMLEWYISPYDEYDRNTRGS